MTIVSTGMKSKDMLSLRQTCGNSCWLRLGSCLFSRCSVSETGLKMHVQSWMKEENKQSVHMAVNKALFLSLPQNNCWEMNTRCKPRKIGATSYPFHKSAALSQPVEVQFTKRKCSLYSKTFPLQPSILKIFGHGVIMNISSLSGRYVVMHSIRRMLFSKAKVWSGG